MKTLDIHTRAACVFQGVAVLIALQRSNTKITFGGFARAIGLIRGDEGWQPWHRRQVSASRVPCWAQPPERMARPR